MSSDSPVNLAASVRARLSDIVSLGDIDGSPESIESMIRDCLDVLVEDGLEFSSDVAVEPITIEDRYPGARAVINGTLSGARIVLQLDIGVADVAVPESGVEAPNDFGEVVDRVGDFVMPAAAAAGHREPHVTTPSGIRTARARSSNARGGRSFGPRAGPSQSARRAGPLQCGCTCIHSGVSNANLPFVATMMKTVATVTVMKATTSRVVLLGTSPAATLKPAWARIAIRMLFPEPLASHV